MPLRSDAPDVLLSLKPDGAETLFVADPSFAALLLARAPALSRDAPALAGPASPGLAVLAAVVAARQQHVAAGPASGPGRRALMPQQTRAAIGGAVVASMAKDRKVCETPASKAALDRLTSVSPPRRPTSPCRRASCCSTGRSSTRSPCPAARSS